jgi:phosphoribosylanthranilate isomerase
MDASLLRTRRTRVKFCGMTSAADVALAVAAGADAVGLILAPSERQVTLEQAATIARAIPPFVSAVAVLGDDIGDADALRALGFTLQFSGDESPETCELLAGGLPYIKVFHLDPGAPHLQPERYAAYSRALWMFDTRVPGRRGGSGLPFDWSALATLSQTRRIVVSGGLTPENVADCLRAATPYAVDVRSGVESGGRKDAAKMRAFVDACGVGPTARRTGRE